MMIDQKENHMTEPSNKDKPREVREAERRQAKEEYISRKRTLLKREEENYTKLYVIKCIDGWYKVFGHSAVILAKHVGRKVGKNYELNEDRDYGVRSEYGCVSIPPTKVDDFKARMLRAGLKLQNEWENGLDYELGERISHEDLLRMIHEDELLAEKANTLVMPNEVLPDLRADMKILLETVHARVRRQEKSARAIFADDMERVAVKMNMLIIAASRGAVKVDECLMSLCRSMELLYEYATTMADLKMLSPKEYFGLAMKIKDMENQVKREMRRREVRKLERKVANGRKRKVSDDEENRDDIRAGAEEERITISYREDEDSGTQETEAEAKQESFEAVAAE